MTDQYKQTKPNRSVLLIPGLGGSNVKIRNRITYETHTVWPRLTKLDSLALKYIKSSTNPEDQELDMNSADWVTFISDENFGLQACDLLMPTNIVPNSIKFYFHYIIDLLIKNGYEPGKTLWGQSNDWRQNLSSPLLQNRLFHRIEEAYYSKDKQQQIHELLTKKRRGRKIDIITHSMGAILLRTFINMNPEFSKKHIRRWIAISTPWQGAGRHVQAYLRGYRFGLPEFMLQDKTMWDITARGVHTFWFVTPRSLPFSPKIAVRVMMDKDKQTKNKDEDKARNEEITQLNMNGKENELQHQIEQKDNMLNQVNQIKNNKTKKMLGL
ncbi:MAG: putative Lecithin:cholesterol acyltransferase 3 [Streblomastix strix]|uniref:Putative Lecithin:cholesterol acyltransferase 3 n=1 Tax=Streblomastix strix TaxID=222440 RepID=A0A5J4VNA9_9EUKA|nr:MAG: putative Lecithin:cholesterol acyltransferase 3 [Streblomastix strix]